MVIIIVGSKSDINWGKLIMENLKKFGIRTKMHISSAHKTPEYLLSLLKKYEAIKEIKVYICAAGRSNALGGFVDGQVSSPVINCPLYSEKYAGLDIFSSLRMPGGIAAVTVLEPDQAALAALKILAIGDKDLRKKIYNYKKRLKEKIKQDDRNLNR